MRVYTAACAVSLALTIPLAGCGGNSSDTSATEPAATTDAVSKSDETSGAEQTPEPEPKPKPKPKPIVIRVVDGRAQGGIARPTATLGDRVVLVVRSDTADEVHLHGYDVSRPVAAGGSARLVFVAKIPGRFEVELEESGVQIAELTVR